jgi:hypothetical protein
MGISQFSVDEVVNAHAGISIVRFEGLNFSPESYFEAGTTAADHVPTEELNMLKRLMPPALVAGPPAPRM